MRRYLVATVMFVGAMASLTVAAGAHAYITESQPDQGGTVPGTPAVIRITFDEPIDVADKEAIVLAHAGGGILACVGGAHIDSDDATSVVCAPAVPLQHGAYVVHWRVISADTHIVHGTYAFGVGVPVGNVQVSDGAEAWDPASPLSTIFRWLGLLGAMTLGGALVMYRKTQSDERVARRIDRLIGIAWLACVAGLIGALVLQCDAAAGSVRGFLDLTTVVGVAASTWGIAWIIRAAFLAALLLIRNNVARLAMAWGVLVTFSFQGHALSFAGGARVGAIAIDIAHFSGAALWLGGLLALAATLPWSLSAVAGFSRSAMVGAAAVLATGVAASFMHLARLADLVTSLYGRLILVKIILFVVLLAFGAYNFRFGRRGGDDRRARRAIIFEAVVAVIVVAVTAVLTGTAPPEHMIMPGM